MKKPVFINQAGAFNLLLQYSQMIMELALTPCMVEAEASLNGNCFEADCEWTLVVLRTD